MIATLFAAVWPCNFSPPSGVPFCLCKKSSFCCHSAPAQNLRRKVGPRAQRTIVCFELYNTNSCSQNDEFATRNGIMRLCLVIKEDNEQETIRQELN